MFVKRKRLKTRKRSVRRQTRKASKRVPEKNPAQVERTGDELLRMVRQLEVWSRDSDLTVSRTAFTALAETLEEVLRWLQTMALLPEASLGGLLRQLPSKQARGRYRRGEHVAAWAGVELARLYKRLRAELWSRSRDTVNRFRDLRFGLQVGTLDPSPNEWFCAEYASRVDYRPTGKMAVWIAGKIEEVRSLKERRRLQYRSLTTALVPTQGDTETILPAWDALFPHERKKLDGVLAATLRCAWRAAQSGGRVVFPALSRPCK
jgi:hypothetical protein